jgi:hypothetical protein
MTGGRVRKDKHLHQVEQNKNDRLIPVVSCCFTPVTRKFHIRGTFTNQIITVRLAAAPGQIEADRKSRITVTDRVLAI